MSEATIIFRPSRSPRREEHPNQPWEITMRDDNFSTMTVEEVKDAYCAEIRELTLAELDGVGGGSHINRPPPPTDNT
jgi:hypothetical protein